MVFKGWFGLPSFALKPRPEVVSCTLSGGGSRASFQLGALDYLYNHDEKFTPTIFVGTSAGSIVASALAQSVTPEGQHDYVRRLWSIWQSMKSSDDMFLPRQWYRRLQAEAPGWMEFVQPPPAPKPRPALTLPFRRTATPVSPASPAEPGNPLEWALTPDEEVRSEWSLAALSGMASHLGRLPRIGTDLNSIWQGLGKTRSMYRPGPMLGHLLDRDTFDADRVSTSGATLRLALVGLESGELRYMTETGTLVDRNNEPWGDGRYDLAVGVLASCSIPAVFRPVPIGSETYVDGGARENLPAELAIGHLGAARNYVVSSQSMGLQRRPRMIDADLFTVVMRSTEILIDEAGRDELAYAHSTGAIVIYPELSVHDAMVVDPGLIDINRDYGWLRAAEAHLGLDRGAELRHRRIIELRIAAMRREEQYLSLESPGRRDAQILRSAKVELRDAVRSATGPALPPESDQWWARWERRVHAPAIDPPWLAPA